MNIINGRNKVHVVKNETSPLTQKEVLNRGREIGALLGLNPLQADVFLPLSS